MFLIIHTPKTAGTSFRLSLQDKYGLSRLALDYGAESEVTSNIVMQYLYSGKVALGAKLLVEKLRAKGYRALVGHYALSRYGEFFSPDEIIAFVREPLVRSCSEYLHKYRNGSSDSTFSEFIENPVNQNMQARILHGYKKEMFIGVTERYKESLAIINRRFGLQIDHRKANLGRRGGGEGLLKNLNQDVIDRFYQLNHKDVYLYQEAEKRLEELIPTPMKKKSTLAKLLSKN